MNERLAADLGRWEEGELRADELSERHPDGQPDDLLQMHARVSLAMSVADEQPDLGWEDLEARLDLDLDAEAERDEDFVSRRRRVPVLKLVVAFVAGALVNPFQPAGTAVEGLRAVARNTADVVVEEMTDVFEPMMPSRAGGVVVLDAADARNLSSVAPEASPAPSGSTEPGEATSDPVSSPPATGAEPTPRPASEPSDSVDEAPAESDEPATAPTEPDGPDDSEETTAPNDPASEPDNGPPSSPPGHERRAERSPAHGGEKAEPTPPRHAKAAGQVESAPPGHAKAHGHAKGPVEGKVEGGPNGIGKGRR